MRPMVTLLLLLLLGFGAADAQHIRCQLTPRPYGLGGACLPDSAAATRPLFRDSVRIWLTSGPPAPPPWRGNLSLPGLETSFEIAREQSAPGAARLVLRTGIFWLIVKEWRELEGPPAECAACDRAARGLALLIDVAARPSASQDDVVILQSALASLEGGFRWNRQEQQQCSPRSDSTGLFCLLYNAVEARMGRYQHRQPALELVRAVIAERWRDRITSHQLVDFNNHPATTMADLRTVLETALARAQVQARPAGR